MDILLVVKLQVALFVKGEVKTFNKDTTYNVAFCSCVISVGLSINRTAVSYLYSEVIFLM